MSNSKLPSHNSKKFSGPLKDWKSIPSLRPRNVRIEQNNVGGDAPKRVIRVYKYDRSSNVRRSNVSSWPRYIAKTAEKWHPIEGVTEYLINQIGHAIGLRMNEFKLYQYNETIWFCSKYFLKLHLGEALIHGTEICGDYLEDHKFAQEIADDPEEARQLFHFEFISEAIEALFPDQAEQLLKQLVHILAFDCLLGNNDRHFYNWGVIYNMNKGTPIRIAPIYDSSRGLFWNFTDDNIKKQAVKKLGLDKFIETYAMKTTPRMTCDENSAVNHFELIKHITSNNLSYRGIVEELASPEKEHLAVQALHLHAGPLLSEYRIAAITKLLSLRFLKTREALQ